LVAWQDINTTPDQAAAVDELSLFLLDAAQQASTLNYGLRPATIPVDATATRFAAAQQYGIELNPVYGALVQAPDRSDAQGLIQWFAATQ
jgi:hypothetical protein